MIITVNDPTIVNFITAWLRSSKKEGPSWWDKLSVKVELAFSIWIWNEVDEARKQSPHTFSAKRRSRSDIIIDFTDATLVSEDTDDHDEHDDLDDHDDPGDFDDSDDPDGWPWWLWW